MYGHVQLATTSGECALPGKPMVVLLSFGALLCTMHTLAVACQVLSHASAAKTGSVPQVAMLACRVTTRHQMLKHH
jgi:hypothetical protein